MSDNRGFDEKDYEKQGEKDEKSREKSMEEKYRNDPLSAIIWALILIWAGVVFLADNMGILESWNVRFEDLPGLPGVIDLGPWSLIFLGAGGIVLLEVLIRLVVPEYRRNVGGTVFFAIFLIGLGLGNIIGWNLIWPFLLIAFGLSLLLGGLFRRG